jgi:WD40 repeat protein
VAADGSKRLLGSYQDATWSPHGLFVAATRGRELTAVEPDGTVRWSRASRRPVSHPAWSPSGFRIAYLAGHSLRVVAGDGTGDHLLDRRISPVAPAWKATPPASPAPREIVSYVDADGRVRTIDADSGRKLWRTGSFLTPVRSVEWSPDGSRLLVVTGSFFTVLGDRGQAIAKGAATGGGPGELSPDGKRIAIVRRSPGTAAARSRLVLSGGHRERRLYAGLGRFGDLAWSPNGEWLLLTWSDADQWLFIRPADDRVMAVAEISRQFAPGGRGRVPFPHLAGWCCAPIP